MSGAIREDPRFWRDLAIETRGKADAFSLEREEKERLLKIAQEYDRLADRRERWQSDHGKVALNIQIVSPTPDGPAPTPLLGRSPPDDTH